MYKSIKVLMMLLIMTPSCISEREQNANNSQFKDMRPTPDMKDAADEGPDLAQVDMGKDLGACGSCEAGTVCDTSSNQCLDHTQHTSKTTLVQVCSPLSIQASDRVA